MSSANATTRAHVRPWRFGAPRGSGLFKAQDLGVIALLAWCAFLTSAGTSAYGQGSADRRIELLSDLELGLGRHWTERGLGRRATRYQVVLDGGDPVLMAHSVRSASALWRTVELPVVPRGSISWRWKVSRSLADNSFERTKRGDDYAARLFVVFGPAGVRLNNGNVLCYVWAGREPAGTVFRSPYAENVAMIVVESGDTQAGRWVRVRRDLVADYRHAFGAAPDSVAAVVLMVDTDDTKSSASAYFADLVLTLEPTVPKMRR